MSIDNSPGAFPSDMRGAIGLTKREWFAGQALNGLISGLMADGSYPTDKSPVLLKAWAYKFADEMLDPTDKQETNE